MNFFEKTPLYQPNTAIIALGGNMGDVIRTFDFVYSELTRHGIHVAAKAPLYKSKSLLKDHQNDYINTVWVIHTALTAENLLNTIKKIEAALGRVDNGRWQERPIDIDIIDFNNTIYESDTLTIPHRHMEHRSFVLYPLADVVPDYISPRSGLTVQQIIGKLTDNLDIEKI